MDPALEANINMSDTFHFSKLNSSNYDSWATSMKFALQSCFYGSMSMVKKICPQLSNLLPLQLIKHQRITRVGKRIENSTKPGCKWIVLL